ncbi:MAG: enoyl-CoA hydratase/isomerase family protein, partial [Betaproteobacteria bacterium]|nr:enoyl-CoA hydratase/isomerase family protein [Betaproteobacteria bacterium]
MLSTEHQAGVITLTLQRPERGNALGPELVEALISAAEAAMADPAVHTLVLRGAGRHFCTGLDLTDLATLSDGDLLLRLVRIETLLALLWRAPIRTVALAHGRTWGAGADLFAVCEQRLVNSDTTLRFPGAQFGIVLGTRRLAQRIGVDAARALVLEGGELDAPQALSLGLATQRVDTGVDTASQILTRL